MFCSSKFCEKHMERYVVLPFSIGGCASESSVSVIENHSKKSKTDQDPSATRAGGGDGLSGVKMKNSLGFLSMPKPNISNGIHRLIKSFKSFSHLFVYKEEKEEMVIGFPTDVIHVAHIGLDGSTTTTTKTATTNPSKGWEMLKAPELLSIPSISFKQFELAMAAQAHSDNTHAYSHTPPSSSPPPPPSLVNNNGSSSKPS